MAPVSAMVATVVASNVLVLVPVNDWLTCGTLTYPLSFLITDVTNRTRGAAAARYVVYAGFALAVPLSAALSTYRVAAASCTAFLCSQLLDVAVFDRLRRREWYVAPLASSALSATVDTVLFIGIAFAGTDAPWVGWAAGDLAAKLGCAVLATFGPYRALLRARRARRGDGSGGGGGGGG